MQLEPTYTTEPIIDGQYSVVLSYARCITRFQIRFTLVYGDSSYFKVWYIIAAILNKSMNILYNSSKSTNIAAIK